MTIDPTTLLVFGKTGQVARELQARMPDATYLDRSAADLSHPETLPDILSTHAPALIINAAAYTAVDKAEEEETLATAINGAAPGAMARYAAAQAIPFLHVSTDYVFEGGGEAPWAPSDPIAPLGAYGRSKAAGEALIAAEGGDYAILRTSWVFSAHGGNFVKTMLRLAESRDALNVVEDQIGGPTAAGDIAAALLTMAEAFGTGTARSGIYHFAGAPATSWAGFARETFRQAGKSVTVTGIPSEAYPTPAARPKNSRMDMTSTTEVFGITPPDWQASLGQVLRDLDAKG